MILIWFWFFDLPAQLNAQSLKRSVLHTCSRVISGCEFQGLRPTRRPSKRTEREVKGGRTSQKNQAELENNNAEPAIGDQSFVEVTCWTINWSRLTKQSRAYHAQPLRKCRRMGAGWMEGVRVSWWEGGWCVGVFYRSLHIQSYTYLVGMGSGRGWRGCNKCVCSIAPRIPPGLNRGSSGTGCDLKTCVNQHIHTFANIRLSKEIRSRGGQTRTSGSRIVY